MYIGKKVESMKKERRNKEERRVEGTKKKYEKNKYGENSIGQYDCMSSVAVVRRALEVKFSLEKVDKNFLSLLQFSNLFFRYSFFRFF